MLVHIKRTFLWLLLLSGGHVRRQAPRKRMHGRPTTSGWGCWVWRQRQVRCCRRRQQPPGRAGLVLQQGSSCVTPLLLWAGLHGRQGEEAILLALLVDERLVLQAGKGKAKHVQRRESTSTARRTSAGQVHPQFKHSVGEIQAACAYQGAQDQLGAPHNRRCKPNAATQVALTMCGMTPPPAMVALISVSSSSSPRMASWRWRGVMRFTLRSLDAFPANSSTC